MKSPGWREANLAIVADAVVAWWGRWRHPFTRLGELFYHLFLIIGYAWVGIRIQMPVISDYLPLKNVLVCLAAILFIGKTVFDTLFYDHYRP